MELPLASIEKELLRLKKVELVQFIISRSLPVKLQKVTMVIDFLNKCRCCDCSNGDIVPITFYSSEKTAEDSPNIIKTVHDIAQPARIWINPQSTIAESSYIWIATNQSMVSEIDLKSNAVDNQSNFKLPVPVLTNVSTVSQPSFPETTVIKNDVQEIKLENETIEECSDFDTSSIKIEYPEEADEENEEKFSTSLDKCKPHIEKEQLENVDEKKMISYTKVKGMFLCGKCDYKASTRKYIRRHMITHSEARPFPCNLCSYKSKTKSQLKKHIEGHSSFKKFLCTLCDYKCSAKYVLKGHMLSHTRGEVTLDCSLCDYKTFQKRLLKAHMEKHKETISFQCETCGTTFKNKYCLQRHILQYHTSDKPFKCDNCDYTCVSKHYLSKHNQCVHLREKAFACEFCDYKCFRKSTLIGHRRIHTGEKPFECSQCDYKSTMKNILRLHMRTHTGEKPFSCDFCGYRAALSRNLKLHVQCVHSDVLPFSCKVCDFKTKYHRVLKKHVVTHEKNVPKIEVIP